MKVTEEFRIVTIKNDPKDPGQLPGICWKVSLGGKQIGEAWKFCKEDAREVSTAETLALVLKCAAKDIKRYIKKKC